LEIFMSNDETMDAADFDAAIEANEGGPEAAPEPAAEPEGEVATPDSSSETVTEEPEQTEPEAKGDSQEETVPPTDKPESNFVPQQRLDEVVKERNLARETQEETQKRLDALEAENQRLRGIQPQVPAKNDEFSSDPDEYEDPLEKQIAEQNKKIDELNEKLGSQSEYLAKQEAEADKQYLEQKFIDATKPDKYPELNRELVEARLMDRVRRKEPIGDKEFEDECRRSHNETLEREKAIVSKYVNGKASTAVKTAVEKSGGPAPSAPPKAPGSWDDVHGSFDQGLREAVALLDD
jgi:uncharacterized coiled-coil protein SlyX